MNNIEPTTAKVVVDGSSTAATNDAACHRVRITASIVVRVGVRVRVSGGSGGLKNTRIIGRTQ